MEVRCISTVPNNINTTTLLTTDYSINGILKINETYTVYAISLWMMKLNYLLVSKEAVWPDWYPAELFQVSKELFHLETYYKYFGDSDLRGVNALWGYQEMILEFSHYTDLIEREKSAMQIFLKRKGEIDEYNK